MVPSLIVWIGRFTSMYLYLAQFSRSHILEGAPLICTQLPQSQIPNDLQQSSVKVPFGFERTCSRERIPARTKLRQTHILVWLLRAGRTQRRKSQPFREL